MNDEPQTSKPSRPDSEPDAEPNAGAASSPGPPEGRAEPTAEDETPQETSSEVARSPLEGLRIKIGSLRDLGKGAPAKPKPNLPVEGPLAPTKRPSRAKPIRPITPPSVHDKLSPELEKELEAALGDMSLDVLIDDSTSTETELESESRVEGRVLSIHREDVFVDLGGRNQGVLPLRQFDDSPQPGSLLNVVVRRLNVDEGLYELTLPGAVVEVGDWSQVAEGLVVEATITGHNKGGLDCQVGSLRGFIPISQIDIYRVDDLQPFVGQKFSCVVTEANERRGNLVLSRRALVERENAEAKKRLWDELEVGQSREGIVRSLKDFGAFVDLGGVEGLIHVSQLSWDRLGHPSEVLEEGQKVRVKIEKIDRGTGRIGLAYRDLSENPWAQAAQKYPVSTSVQGTVTKIMDFGALVRLEPGISGMIHISELSHKRVWRVSDAVKEGQDVEVMVLSVDPQAQRIGLSLKALEARPLAEKKPLSDEDEAEAIEGRSAKTSPQKQGEKLKGGLDRGSGGEKFGLKW